MLKDFVLQYSSTYIKPTTKYGTIKLIEASSSFSLSTTQIISNDRHFLMKEVIEFTDLLASLKVAFTADLPITRITIVAGYTGKHSTSTSSNL